MNFWAGEELTFSQLLRVGRVASAVGGVGFRPCMLLDLLRLCIMGAAESSERMPVPTPMVNLDGDDEALPTGPIQPPKAQEAKPVPKIMPVAPKLQDEATAAALLDALLTSFLPAIRRTMNDKLYELVTTGEPIRGGIVEVLVERKLPKSLALQLAGTGLHTGTFDRESKLRELAPLVADQIVQKLEVNVSSVKAGAAVEKPAQPFDALSALKGLFGSATGRASVEAKERDEKERDGALVVECQLDFFVHFAKARHTSAVGDEKAVGEDSVPEAVITSVHQLVQAVASREQTLVGANAIEFSAFGVRTELRHLEVNARVRLWIDFANQQLKVQRATRPPPPTHGSTAACDAMTTICSRCGRVYTMWLLGSRHVACYRASSSTRDVVSSRDPRGAIVCVSRGWQLAFLERPKVDLDLEVDVLCVNLPDVLEDTLPEAIMAGLCASWSESNPLIVPLKPKDDAPAETAAEPTPTQVDKECGTASSGDAPKPTLKVGSKWAEKKRLLSVAKHPQDKETGGTELV